MTIQTDQSNDSEDLIVDVADEFLERLRRNEHPTVEEYTARYPALEDKLTSYLPIIATMENVAADDTLAARRDDTQSVSGIDPPKHSGDLPIGSTFGRYDIIKQLGAGAMGIVYLANDQRLGRSVALKVAKLDRNDDQAVQRFEREARAIALVKHPNLCSIYDVDEQDGRHFLTMEYVEGETLAAKLNRGDQYSMQQAADLVRTIAVAVQAAHEAGIIHRDLKPANIMINERDEPVVMDFGLARSSVIDDSELTHAGAILGSPAYMAPEQVLADHDRVGPATDVYALGVLLYQTLCGCKPFDGSSYSVMKQIETANPPSPSSIREGVDRRLEAICLRAMSKRIGDRHESAADFATELSTYTSDVLPNAHKANRGWIIALAIAVLFIAVALPAAMLSQRAKTTNELAPETTATVEFARIDDKSSEATSSDASMLLPPRPIATAKSSAHFVSIGEPIGGSIRAVELGDFDGDGDLDALLARHRSRLMVMLNDGSGNFSEGPPINDPDTWRDWEITLGDVDADGDIDAFVTRNGNDKLWLNDGNAHFTLSEFDFGDFESNQARFGDIDRDGDLDLFVAQRGRSVLWINDGFGKLTDSGQHFDDKYYCGCALGDLNGDGSLDIFVGTVESSSQVWLNDGDGTFGNSHHTIEALAVWDITLADWENDGDLDVFVSNHEGPSSMWLNNGEGFFTLDQHGPSSRKTVGLCIADLDGDSDLDVLESNAADGDQDTVWLNDGERLFATNINLPSIDAQRWAIGDLDNDGDIDIFTDRVWVNQSNSVAAERLESTN